MSTYMISGVIGLTVGFLAGFLAGHKTKRHVLVHQVYADDDLSKQLVDVLSKIMREDTDDSDCDN